MQPVHWLQCVVCLFLATPLDCVWIVVAEWLGHGFRVALTKITANVLNKNNTPKVKQITMYKTKLTKPILDSNLNMFLTLSTCNQIKGKKRT